MMDRMLLMTGTLIGLFYGRELVWKPLTGSDKKVVLISSKLSPFCLALGYTLDYYGIHYEEASDLSVLSAGYSLIRGLLVKARLLPLAVEFGELDEFPLVPFLLAEDGKNMYDSVKIAHHYDTTRTHSSCVPLSTCTCARTAHQCGDCTYTPRQ